MTTAAPKATRFFHPGLTKCYYLPDVVDIENVARADLDAGTDLSDDIADISGWVVSSNQIDTPDLGRTFTSNITGRTSVEDSSITFYADEAGEDVRTVLPRSTEGYLAWLDGGDVADNKMDLFPIRVSSVGKMRTMEDTAGQLTIAFAITDVPIEDVTVPAAA